MTMAIAEPDLLVSRCHVFLWKLLRPIFVPRSLFLYAVDLLWRPWLITGPDLVVSSYCFRVVPVDSARFLFPLTPPPRLLSFQWNRRWRSCATPPSQRTTSDEPFRCFSWSSVSFLLPVLFRWSDCRVESLELGSPGRCIDRRVWYLFFYFFIWIIELEMVQNFHRTDLLPNHWFERNLLLSKVRFIFQRRTLRTGHRSVDSQLGSAFAFQVEPSHSSRTIA